LAGAEKKRRAPDNRKKRVRPATEARARASQRSNTRPKDGGAHKKAAKPGDGGTGPDAAAKAKAAQKALPKNLKPVTPDEIQALFSKGKTKSQHLAVWNRQIGQAADENKRIVDEIVAEKLGPIKRKLKAGEKTVEVGLHAYYILNSPRLDGLQNKEALYAYVGLSMIEALEEFRKANRLTFTYLAKK